MTEEIRKSIEKIEEARRSPPVEEPEKLREAGRLIELAREQLREITRKEG